jgi:Fic family protein
LESLYQVWLDQKATIDEKAFAAELAREWSIETGIIEGVYTLDRGTTEVLIRRGIDSSYISREATNRDPAQVAQIIQAHEDALEGLFDFVAHGRELSTSYIKELHAALLRHQDVVKGVDQFGTEIYIELKKGEYKQQPNSPTRRDKAIHEYCPPEHVPAEMDRLMEFHKQHVQRAVPALVEAAWLHHGFTQIHPFQDGNGRVARALASLILIKGGFFPLVVHRDNWEKYIDALEAADEGDLPSLVGLFARLQRRDLTKAIVHAAEAKPAATLDEAIVLTRDALAAVADLPPKHPEAEQRAEHLRTRAFMALLTTAQRLGSGVKGGPSPFRFVAGRKSTLAPEVAAAAVLALEAKGLVAEIVVSLQTSFRGIVLARVTLQRAEGSSVSLSDQIFVSDQREAKSELDQRFTEWLDDCLIRGLAEWRKTLV